MFRTPTHPSTAHPSPFEWPERWKQQAAKALAPGAGAREIMEAKRMGGTLAHMQQKDLPSIQSEAKASKR